MGYARELIPGGVWVASAVTVAGYTWQAVTGNQESSPLPTFGGGSLLSQLPIVGPAGSWIGNAAANVYDFFFGPNVPQRPANLPPEAEAQHLVTLAKKHPLPVGFESSSLTDIGRRGTPSQKHQATRGFSAWAARNGWKQVDIDAWLKFNQLPLMGKKS